MVFSDAAFVFYFLPVALLFILPVLRTRLAPLMILVFSLGFFYWSSGLYTLLLVVSILLNFAGGLLVKRFRSQALLAAVVTLNLLLLIYYKYAGFLLTNVFPESHDWVRYAETIILPIGISFYTFQGISYVVDVWRGDTEAERDPVRFGAYLSFFPQLIAGPIVRFKDVRNDFLNPKVSTDNMIAGASRFSAGLFKKVVVADTCAVIADAAFAASSPGELGMAGAWIGALAYTIQIYFDFSGYSDMALGIALMFGIRIPENFNHPYAAPTITNFWRRWHISLSSWFRDYLYIPLGGNRQGPGRTYFNLVVVFATTGIWHGAAWTFMIWGLWHGAFIVGERLLLGKRAAVLENEWARYFYAFPVVVFGWVLFRAESLPQALAYMAEMVSVFEPGAFDIANQFVGLNSFQLAVFFGAVLAMMLQGRYVPLGRWVAQLAYEPAPGNITPAAREAARDAGTAPIPGTGEATSSTLPNPLPAPVAPVEPLPAPAGGRVAGLAVLGRPLLAWGLLAYAALFVVSQNFSPFLYFRF